MAVFMVAVAAALPACAGALAESKAEFAKGHYAQAKAALDRAKPEVVKDDDPAKRAEYALYRGLVDNALGDREAASSWLREARELEDDHPGALDFEDVMRLRIALVSAQRTAAAP
jgi:hypothetical protein